MQHSIFKIFLLGFIFALSTQANATEATGCFKIWGQETPEFDSICFDSEGQVRLFNNGALKLQVQANKRLVPAHTIIRSGLSEGHVLRVPPSYQYSIGAPGAEMYLDVTIPLEIHQDIHTRYGEFWYRHQHYIVGQ
jgi:hypothetical protein